MPPRLLDKDRALEIFSMFVGLGFAVSVKHIRGDYYVEIPVRLKGDKAYGKESEIMQLAMRGGFTAIQAGQCMRIA